MIGLFLTAWGLLLAWMAYSKGEAVLLEIGLVVSGSGAWIAGLHRLVRSHSAGRSVPGGLLLGWGVVGILAAIPSHSWIAALVCVLVLSAGLAVLGVLPLPAWAHSALAALGRIGPGLAVMGVGLFFVGVGLAGGASEGVPAFVVVAAGLAFFLAGAFVAFYQRGSPDSVLTRVLAALLVTSLATAGVVFPPSLLATAPLAVLSWIAVFRLVVQNRTGRDPLANWSDGRVLGLGCGITVTLVIVAAALLYHRSCALEPEARPPAEAAEPSRSPGP